VFLALVTVEGYTGIFIVNTISGKIYHESRVIPRNWLSSPSVRGNALMRKKIQSCSGMKVRVGSVNFLDRLTPFVICGMCLKLTVRLLMTYD
jgi:hypothetical protein